MTFLQLLKGVACLAPVVVLASVTAARGSDGPLRPPTVGGPSVLRLASTAPDLPTSSRPGPVHRSRARTGRLARRRAAFKRLRDEDALLGLLGADGRRNERRLSPRSWLVPPPRLVLLDARPVLRVARRRSISGPVAVGASPHGARGPPPITKEWIA